MSPTPGIRSTPATPPRPATPLTPTTPTTTATPPTLASTAVALATAVLLLAACTACTAAGTGARDEGPARTGPVGNASPRPTRSTTPSPDPRRVNAVELVLTDPKVSGTIKRELKPCTANSFPIDVSYGKLTDSGANDVVVNVMTCDSVGVGSYVYRVMADGGTYENVFQDEEPPVYAEIDRGDLVVTQKIYTRGDAVTYPSSEDVITYHWSASGSRFTEQDRTHNYYSNAGGDKVPTEEN